MPAPTPPADADREPAGTNGDGPPARHPPGAGRAAAGRLVVVRHGQTEWSRDGRHTGRTDVPLLPEGERQAAVLRDWLAGCRFSSVLVSPLERARRTCDLAGFGASAAVCDDLAEWDYGDVEGRTSAEVRAERPGWTLWHDGVTGGETLDQVAARADRVVAAAAAAPGDTIAFAHGHVLRVVAARWLGLQAASGAHFELGPAAIGVLGWEHGTPVISAWNLAGGDIRRVV